MTYYDFVQEIENALIVFDEDSGNYYLDPDWKYVMDKMNIDLRYDPDDRVLSYDDVEDILKLEVERRNMIADKKNIVYDFLCKIILSTTDAMKQNEGNDMIKLVTEYMREKNKLKDTQKDVEGKINTADILIDGMSMRFDKKE